MPCESYSVQNFVGAIRGSIDVVAALGLALLVASFITSRRCYWKPSLSWILFLPAVSAMDPQASTATSAVVTAAGLSAVMATAGVLLELNARETTILDRLVVII